MDESYLKESNSDMQILALAMLLVGKLLVALAMQYVVQYEACQISVPPPKVTDGFGPHSLPYLPRHFCFTL